MLSSKLKIKRASFSEVLSRGKSFHSPSFTLRVLKKKSLHEEPSSFSFVVSQKIAKKATARNLLKRRGYTVIKKLLGNIKPCYICVFFAKKEFARLRSAELEKEVFLLLKKAGIMKS